MNKQWFHSKTIWTDVGAIIILVIEWAAGAGEISLAVSGLLLAIVSIILRRLTNTGITK